MNSNRFNVTNRRPSKKEGFGGKIGDELRYLVDDAPATAAAFRRSLFDELGKHVAPVIVLMLHGFNVSWREALDTFALWGRGLTSGAEGGLVPVGFSWATKGSAARYLDDRGAARASAEPLARAILDAVRMLQAAGCLARLAVVAHSMGSYLLSRACAVAWEMSGKPTDLNVLAEVLMVAPDLDAEVFKPGGDSLPVAALARRVTVYHSRHDQALLASSAKRAGVTGARLGRQGSVGEHPANVVSVDATKLVTPDCEGGSHSGYFQNERVLLDMRRVLVGIDRAQLERTPQELPGFFSL